MKLGAFLALLVLFVPCLTVATAVNLALQSNGGVATQSTTVSGRVASLANDGNTDGDYGNGSVTHSAFGDYGAWWQVDLGATFSIDQIDIWNRTDSSVGPRLHHFTVSILDGAGGSAWSSYIVGPAGAHETYGSMDGIALAAGQFVKIQLDDAYTTDRYLHIAEVQVWEIPEPSAVLLLCGAGIASMLRWRRKYSAAFS